MRKRRPPWGTRTVAKAALSRWKLARPEEPQYVQFGENATWRIRTSSAIYSLRVYRPERWTVAQRYVEHRLMSCLGDDFGVGMALPGRDGKTVQTVPGTTFRAALFPWAAGRLCGGTPSHRRLHRWGAYMGRMHAHLLDADLPAGGRRWDEETLIWKPLRVAEAAWPSLFDTGSFPERFHDIAHFCERRWHDRAPAATLVHADLHLGNLKWSGTSLMPIDFDDCGVAPLPYDLAVPASSFFRSADGTATLQSFLEGYAETAPRHLDLTALQLFMAIRKIWILGWCIERPELFSPDYLRKRCTTVLEGLERFHEDASKV